MTVEKLGFAYPCGRQILRDVSFSVAGGECLAILGNNGAGKSTLLKCLDRLLPAQTGRAEVDGVDLLGLPLGELARQVAFVAQNGQGSRLTVYDTLLLGRKPYMKWGASQRDYSLVSDTLRRMGLENMAVRYLDQLSGGEQQKILLARALVQEPSVLLLDEPTSNLDLKNQYEVLGLVRQECQTRGIAAVLVLHDLNLALRFCHRFLFLREGSVYAAGGREVVTPENIRAVYGIDAAVAQVAGRPVVVPGI